MERVSVTWGAPRRTVVYPAVSAELAGLLAADLSGVSVLSVDALQDNLVGADIDGAGALSSDFQAGAFTFAVALDGAGALTGDMEHTHALGAALAETGALTGDLDVSAGSSDPAFRAAAVSYTGNGGTLSVTGVGFQPELIIIYNLDDSTGAERWGTIASSVGDHFPIGQPGGTYSGDTFNFSGVSSFDADGFTLGSTGVTNSSGTNYLAVCFAAGEGAQTPNFEQKVLTNTGVEDTFAHGLGTAPVWVWHKRPDEGEGEWITDVAFGEDSESVGDEDFAARTGGTVQAVSASDITLGTATRWNTGADDSLLIMFGGEEVSGEFKTGTYVEGAASGVSVTGLGFQPKVVLIRATNDVGAGILADAITDGNARLIAAGNPGQAFTLDADGFTIDSQGILNASSVEYRYFAWG